MILNQKNSYILSYILNADDLFPNSVLPLIVYKSALELNSTSEDIKKLLKNNGWENSWSGGIYTHHHYHSTAHEVLCVYEGNATLLFGGDKGIVMLIKKGDVVVIPAGVAHKNLDASETFRCIGAYPKGQDYDMNIGRTEEIANALKNIAALELPESDPIFGAAGPLLNHWKKQNA